MVTSEAKIKDTYNLTDIPRVIQQQSYSLYPDPSNYNQIILESRLTNESVKAPYELNTIGFYAGNGLVPASSNVLLAVITAVEPDTVPAWSSYPINLNFKAIITYDKDAKVAVYATYDGEITKDQVHSIVKAHNDDYAAHGELINFYNLMSMRNTKYSYIKSSENKIIETIKTAGSPSRLIAENISEKKADGWQVTEKLYDLNDEKNKLMRTRTTTYKKVGNEWEATVV